MEPEVVVDVKCALGEGPLWHVERQALDWVDYLRGEIHRFVPATGVCERIHSGPRVSGFTFQADGSLLLFEEGPKIVSWRDGVSRTLIDGFPGSEGMHFNDVVADPMGRVFAGTVPDDSERYADRVGVLYRIDPDARLTPLVDGIGISNGLAFSPRVDRLYFADTLSRRIDVFDYDAGRGSVANRRLLVEIPPGEGVPDGMTVDCEGFVWSARWDGSAVHRYAPNGREDLRIDFPARKITSVMFGGPDLSDLYVTSAGGEDREAEGPAAGALFRLATGMRGLSEYRSRIGLA